jgi:Na+/proline symporter
MNRLQALYLHACVFLTAGTGAVYAWMKYAMRTEDPFAVVNHPVQPFLLSAHVVIAPLLVFGFGWVFADHIWPKFVQKNAPQRKSGLWSMGAIVPMVLSGYLMQVMAGDVLRQAMAVAHWTASALFVLAYSVHLIRKPERPLNGTAS